MKRVFNIDIETCRACGRALEIIACTEELMVVKTILTHVNENAPSAGTELLPQGTAREIQREFASFGEIKGRCKSLRSTFGAKQFVSNNHANRGVSW